MVLPAETSHTRGWRLARVREEAPSGLSPWRVSCPRPAGSLPQFLPSPSFLMKGSSQLVPPSFQPEQLGGQEGWLRRGG